MDERQKGIINSWYNKSEEQETDPYSAYISLWIALNAYCIARYSEGARRLVANINNRKGLKALQDESVAITDGSIGTKSGEYYIDIRKPGRIRIVLKEKFFESAIFEAFAEEYGKIHYPTLLEKVGFKESVLNLQSSLEKASDIFYLVDMSRHREYSSSLSVEEMSKLRIIILFDDITNFEQLKNVLYQIRCNLFHGEKFPGILNDDRIMHAAHPVLLTIMASLLPLS